MSVVLLECHFFKTINRMDSCAMPQEDTNRLCFVCIHVFWNKNQYSSQHKLLGPTYPVKVKTSSRMSFSKTRVYLYDDLFFNNVFLTSIIAIHIIRCSQISHVPRTWLITRIFTKQELLIMSSWINIFICCWMPSRSITIVKTFFFFFNKS